MRVLDFLSSVVPPGHSRLKAQPLSDGVIKYLHKNLKTKKVEKLDYLLRAGQTSKFVYFIESGLLRCYYINDSGKEVNRWFMREGGVVFSIKSFYTQKPGQEYIQALEPTELYYISYDELDQIYFEFPEFDRKGRLLTEKYYAQWDDKLQGVETKSAKERVEWLVTNHQQLLDRVPDYHLASWLGITEGYFSQLKSGKK